MDSFRVLFKPSAQKELGTLPRDDLRRVLEKISNLAKNPRPRGCEKMTGEEFYRLRQGDWRVIYEIDEAARAVRVFKVGHRRDVYR